MKIEELIEQIHNTLNGIVPSEHLQRPEGIFPCLKFHFYNARGEEFADNREVETSYPLQVDVYAEKSLQVIVIAKEIKKALKEIEFYRQVEFMEIETIATKKIYRYVMTFSHIENNESEE